MVAMEDKDKRLKIKWPTIIGVLKEGNKTIEQK